MSLQEAFEQAWIKTSTNNIDKDAAMNWFYEGVAAQKKAQPEVRMADPLEFSALRNAQAAGQAEIVSDRAKFFSTLATRYVAAHGHSVELTTADIEDGAKFIEQIQADGAHLNSWTITNMCKRRVERYVSYDGFHELQAKLDSLVKRSAIATGKAA